METISPGGIINWTWWVTASGTELNIIWYIGLFKDEQQLKDIVIIETIIIFIILFTLIFSKLLITKIQW
jgi:hypothetical protein